jgi:diguanylate cyclase
MSDLTELGLQKSDVTAAAAAGADAALRGRDGALAHFLDRLLQCLVQLAPESEPGERELFTSRLREYRESAASRRGSELDTVADACLAMCRRYFERSLWYHSEREKELSEVISILTDAAKLSLGESASFHSQVLQTADRFTAITEIENIRELKRRMSDELDTLRRVVAEKQERDQQAFARLSSRVETLQGRLAVVEEEITLDPLTAVGNRRRFELALPRMVSAAKDAGAPLSLCLVDIDEFKSVNDTHGHPIGDRVLVGVAQLLTKAVRQSDVVARYGGDEFVLLLANTAAADVEARMRKLVADIAACTYDYELLGRRETVRFTVSCGLADLAPGESQDELMMRVDEALYEAKKKGRNRLSVRKRSLLGRVLAWN